MCFRMAFGKKGAGWMRVCFSKQCLMCSCISEVYIFEFGLFFCVVNDVSLCSFLVECVGPWTGICLCDRF